MPRFRMQVQRPEGMPNHISVSYSGVILVLEEIILVATASLAST